MESEIIKAIKEDQLYGFVSSNYHKMSKEELRDLILELFYMIRYDYVYSVASGEIVNKYIIECLQENRDWHE